jgi:hypothetical protein
VGRWGVVLGCVAPLLVAVVPGARADEPPIEIPPRAPETPALSEASPRDQATEAPPERPRPQGLVLESGLGILGFAGRFRHVSPPAFWLHGQLGYEVTRGVMIFADGDLAWTDTSESQEEANTYGVTLWGFGGGVRGTVHVRERAAFYVQGEVGALAADVKHDELAVLGFRRAESLNASFGGRAGVEWYLVDRRLAVSASGGLRYADGFARVVGPSDLPLLWDAGIALRYAF